MNRQCHLYVSGFCNCMGDKSRVLSQHMLGTHTQQYTVLARANKWFWDGQPTNDGRIANAVSCRVTSATTIQPMILCEVGMARPLSYRRCPNDTPITPAA